MARSLTPGLHADVARVAARVAQLDPRGDANSGAEGLSGEAVTHHRRPLDERDGVGPQVVLQQAGLLRAEALQPVEVEV